MCTLWYETRRHVHRPSAVAWIVLCCAQCAPYISYSCVLARSTSHERYTTTACIAKRNMFMGERICRYRLSIVVFLSFSFPKISLLHRIRCSADLVCFHIRFNFYCYVFWCLCLFLNVFICIDVTIPMRH